MAEITQWQIDRLCAQTGVPEPAARSALEQTNGDLLSAVLLLEKVGQTRKTSGGYYSTATGAGEPSIGGAGETAPPTSSSPKGEDGTAGKDSVKAAGNWGAFFKRVLDVLLKLRWEVWREGKRTMAIPVLLMLILLCIRAPLVLIILGVCLFFGCRYRLSGTMFPGMEAINAFLDGAYALVSDLMGEAKSKHNVSKQDGDDKRRNR